MLPCGRRLLFLPWHGKNPWHYGRSGARPDGDQFRNPLKNMVPKRGFEVGGMPARVRLKIFLGRAERPSRSNATNDDVFVR
jgi:hypothetical protein